MNSKYKDLLVYIADDHRLVAEGFSSLLGEVGFTKIKIFPSGKSLYKACLDAAPDLVFLDIYMTDWDGITTLKELRKERKKLPITIVSMTWEGRVVESCLHEGANAFLHKSCDVYELKEAIEALFNEQQYISSKVSDIQKSKSNVILGNYELTEPISAREKDVLLKICEGLSFEEIAEALYISKATVETHKKKLLHKFKVNSVSKLVAIAYKHNFIS
jgi:DNA-binding NarL/FixJ family response regulator